MVDTPLNGIIGAGRFMNYSAKAPVFGFNCCALGEYSPPYLKTETQSELLVLWSRNLESRNLYKNVFTAEAALYI
jgi:hypothetical protein